MTSPPTESSRECELCKVSFSTKQECAEHNWTFRHQQNKNIDSKAHCDLCQVTVSSLSHYEDHINGKKHKKALLRWRQENNFVSTDNSSHQRTGEMDQQSSYRASSATFTDKYGQRQNKVPISRRGRHNDFALRNFLYPEPFLGDSEWRADCRYNYKPWEYSNFSPDLFRGTRPWGNRRGLLGPRPLLPMGRANFMGPPPRHRAPGPNDFGISSHNTSFHGNLLDMMPTLDKATANEEDKSDVPIEHFRSSIAKKADLSTPSSTDDVDAKTKSTLKFSAKTSQIIDDVLMGRAPKPKVVNKRDLVSSEVISTKGQRTSDDKKATTSKRSQLLEKAKKVCEESRIKRNLAKKSKSLKENQAKYVKDMNQEIDQLTKRALSNISGDISASSRYESVSEPRYPDDDELRSLDPLSCGGSSDLQESTSSLQQDENTYHDLQETHKSAKRFGRSSSPKGKTKMGKDNLKKLITAPRSRKDQMMVAKMMQNYSKTKSSLRSRLTINNDPQSDLESPIDMGDLPDDVQNQIAQLLMEEADGEDHEPDPGPMEVSELNVKKEQTDDMDSEDDLEMVMIQEDEISSPATAKIQKEYNRYIESSALDADSDSESMTKFHRLENSASASSSNTDSNMVKRRRSSLDTISKESQRSTDFLQVERDLVTKRPRIVTESERSSHGQNSGTVERLLQISLQEENIRRKLVQTEQEIQQFHVIIMQAQQQLQSKVAQRDQLTKEETKLRKKRFEILKDAVSSGESMSSSQHSSQTHEVHVIEPTHVKEEPASSSGKELEVVIREPDTTTVLDSSSDPSPSFNEENIISPLEQFRCERTLSQSSAEQSGDGEYRAQYLGTLPVNTVLKQFAANMPDLKRAPFLIVDEQDIMKPDSEKQVEHRDSHVVEDSKGTMHNKVNLKHVVISEESGSEDEQGNHIKDCFVISEKSGKNKKNSTADKTCTIENKHELFSDESGSEEEQENLGRDCFVALQNLDTDLLQYLQAGSPVIVEDDDVLNIQESQLMKVEQQPTSPLVRRKRKTKKIRDRSRRKGKTKASVVSDESETEDKPQSDPEEKLSRSRKKCRRISSSPDSKLLQEYLHASSSSDVELDDNKEKTRDEISATNSEKLKIKPTCLTAMRKSAQKMSIGKKPVPADELATYKPLVKSYKGHTGTVHCMQACGRYVFTGSEDCTARKFNMETGECEAVYEGHNKGIQCLCIFRHPKSSSKLITGSFDRSIITYDIETDTQENQMFFPDRVLCCCEYNRKLYLGLGDGTIPVIDLMTMKECDTLYGSDQGVRCIKTAKEGTRDLILTASVDGTVSIKDICSGLFMRSIMGHTKTPLDMQVVNNLLYTAGADKTVQVHDFQTGDPIECLNHRGVVTSVWVDDDYLYTAGYESVVSCYSKQKYEKEKMFYGAGKGVITSMLVHDGKLFTGAKDGFVESIRMPNKDLKWVCKFGRCSKVFGLKEHLEHHVVKDHIISSQTIHRCLWNDCTAYLHVQDKMQETMEHILHHVNE